MQLKLQISFLILPAADILNKLPVTRLNLNLTRNSKNGLHKESGSGFIQRHEAEFI